MQPDADSEAEVARAMADFQRTAMTFAERMTDMAAVATRMQQLMIEDTAQMMAAMEAVGLRAALRMADEKGSKSDE